MARMEGIITYASRLHAVSVMDRLIAAGWMDNYGWLTDPSAGYQIECAMDLPSRQLVVPDYEYPFSEDVILDHLPYSGWLVSTKGDISLIYTNGRKPVRISHDAWRCLGYAEHFTSAHEGISSYAKQRYLLEVWKHKKPATYVEKARQANMKKFIQRMDKELISAAGSYDKPILSEC